MALRAIIFCVDGTLANTERDGHRPAFNAAFAEMGLPWHWGESFYGTLLVKGGGLERVRFYAEHFDPATFARPDFEEFIQRLYELKTRNYQRLLAAGAIPRRVARREGGDAGTGVAGRYLRQCRLRAEEGHVAGG